MGGITPQSGDWCKHNAVLRDLIQKGWPVLYDNHGEHSMLTYYLGQYMVPALGGKILYKFLSIFSISSLFNLSVSTICFFVSEIIMFIWNCTGLFLVCCHLFFLLQNPKQKFLLVIAFCFFGNPLILGKIIYSLAGFYTDFSSYHWLDFENYLLQYSTNFVLLRWVFQHCLVPWIVMGMLLDKCATVQTYVFVGLPVALYSPFAFLGMLPFMFINLIKHVVQKDRGDVLKRCFSIPNLLALFSLGIFLFLYYIDYFMAEKPPSLHFTRYLSLNVRDIVVYILFCLFTFGIYAVYLIKDFGKNLFYWVAVVSLLFLPFFHMGKFNDLVMRVSVPALYVLCVFCLDVLVNKRKTHGRLFICSFSVLLLIGYYYPVREFVDVVMEDNIFDLQERDDYGTLEQYANPEYNRIYQPEETVSEDLLWNYYTYDAEKCIFLKTIGKK